MERLNRNVKYLKSITFEAYEKIKRNYEKKISIFKRIFKKYFIHNVYTLNYNIHQYGITKSSTILEYEKTYSKSMLRYLFSKLGMWYTNSANKRSLTIMGLLSRARIIIFLLVGGFHF